MNYILWRGVVTSLILLNPLTAQIGRSEDAKKATIIFENQCTSGIRLMSTSNPALNQFVNNGTPVKIYPKDLSAGARNSFHAAPKTTDAQCSRLSCSSWTDIQKTGQRMGYMWMNNTVKPYNGAHKHNNNLAYAAYCQPTNAAVQQCSGSPTPCCGRNMNYDATFGTLFEITPNGAGGQDFVDLSTNYGSGPTSPPPLCQPGKPSDNCVSVTANIFFNVPVQVKMTAPCKFSTQKTQRKEISCKDISCKDAYQYPTDDKQMACPSGTTYHVIYCPNGSALPPIPN